MSDFESIKHHAENGVVQGIKVKLIEMDDKIINCFNLYGWTMYDVDTVSSYICVDPEEFKEFTVQIKTYLDAGQRYHTPKSILPEVINAIDSDNLVEILSKMTDNDKATTLADLISNQYSRHVKYYATAAYNFRTFAFLDPSYISENHMYRYTSAERPEYNKFYDIFIRPWVAINDSSMYIALDSIPNKKLVSIIREDMYDSNIVRFYNHINSENDFEHWCGDDGRCPGRIMHLVERDTISLENDFYDLIWTLKSEYNHYPVNGPEYADELSELAEIFKTIRTELRPIAGYANELSKAYRAKYSYRDPHRPSFRTFVEETCKNLIITLDKGYFFPDVDPSHNSYV